MIRKIGLALAATLLITGSVLADPIEGRYRSSESGETVNVSACGAGFCMSYVTGPHKGKQLGTFKRSGSEYSGTIVDWNDGGKEYTGKGKLSGRNLVAGGCILAGLVCRNVTYTRL